MDILVGGHSFRSTVNKQLYQQINSDIDKVLLPEISEGNRITI